MDNVSCFLSTHSFTQLILVGCCPACCSVNHIFALVPEREIVLKDRNPKELFTSMSYYKSLNLSKCSNNRKNP